METTNAINTNGTSNPEAGKSANANEQAYHATNNVINSALTQPPPPRNPYTLPASQSDGPGSSWVRDPKSQAWSRKVSDQSHTFLPEMLRSTRLEMASAERSAQLDQAAHAIIVENIANSPQSKAQNYQSDYNHHGWSQYGPMPAAVTAALNIPANQLQASDGQTYTRIPNGDWTTLSSQQGRKQASDDIREELGATLLQKQAMLASRSAVPPDTTANKIAPETTRANGLVTQFPQPQQKAPGTQALPPQLDNPKSPGHALYTQALTGLQAYNATKGFKVDDAINKSAAAALAVQAHKEGLVQINSVTAGNGGTRLYAMQGKPGDVFSKVVSVDTNTAHATSIADSSTAYQIADRSAQRQAAQDQQQQTSVGGKFQSGHDPAVSWKFGIGIEPPVSDAISNGVLDASKDTGHTFAYMTDGKGEVVDQVSVGPAVPVGTENRINFLAGNLPAVANYKINKDVLTYTWSLTDKQYQNCKTAFSAMKNSPGMYTPENQCTTAAVALAAQCGIKIPNGVSEVSVVPLVLNKNVSNPYGLQQQLSKLQTPVPAPYTEFTKGQYIGGGR